MSKSLDKKKFSIAVGLLLLLAVVALVSVASQGEPASQPAQQPPTVEEEGPDPAMTTEQTATYSLKYDVTWSSDSHPQTLPDGAHVSPIVIIAHKAENDLFSSGGPATDGIEIMAETGATAVLSEEIEANPSIIGTAIGQRIDAPGANSLKIKLDQDHPLLSAVSMLAPSPDWFVAVSNVELFKDGRWLEEIELTMRPYDAGTDSGETFTAADSDTDPAGSIGPPLDDQFIAASEEGAFATLKITKD